MPQGVVLASQFPGSNTTEKLDKAIEACEGKRSFLIATPDIGLGAPSYMPDNVTLIDLRQESLRILRRGFPLSDGAPQYFANEPNNSTLLAADSVPSNVSHAQDQAIAGLIDNHSPNVNAVGVWGGARALAEGSRAWGGFFNVSNSNFGSGYASQAPKDAQLIALEVDVINWGLPGVYPNHSKVGLQIVGLGEALNTNAIEILSSEKGKWVNGIVFMPNSIAENGTVIGIDGKVECELGIDFANTKFKDAAMRIGPGQKIRMDGSNGNASIIYREAESPDQLVLVAGTGGLKVMDNTGTRVLLELLPDGTLKVAGRVTAFEKSE